MSSTYADDVRRSYDTVAASYAAMVTWELLPPVPRAFVGAFAEIVSKAAVPQKVLDAGCGPGQIAARLAEGGMSVEGVDLSPGMVAQARAAHPELKVSVADIVDLPSADASFGGVMLWYSLIHMDAEARRRAVAEAARVLAPGGHLLIGWHIGDEVRRKTEGYGGLPMGVDLHLMPHTHVEALVAGAGLDVSASISTAPEHFRGSRQGMLLAQRPPD